MKLLYIVLIVSAVGCCTAADTKDLNKVMDQFIDSMKGVIIMNKLDAVEVPTMFNQWQYTWGLLKFNGKVTCKDGVAKSLKTLKRIGDTSLKPDGNHTTLITQLALDEFRVKFESCEFVALHLFSSRSVLRVNIGSNKIELEVALSKDGDKCNAALGRVQISFYDKITIDSPASVIRKIDKSLTKWAGEHFHAKVVPAVDNKLAEAINKALTKTNICSQIPL